jgi:hypothetical protein
MSNTENPRKWVPEIMYEEYDEENISGGLPFIQVPEGREMPDILFMFGSLDADTYDAVRLALGLQPLQQAVTAGMKISQNILNTEQN